jgi:spore coat protein JB
MMEKMTEKMNADQLSDWIGMLNFCAYDMLLYLDTHPDDEDGIAYFNQCVEMKKQADRKYREVCGSTTAYGGVPYGDYFSWSSRPLPWEGGSLCGSMKNA